MIRRNNSFKKTLLFRLFMSKGVNFRRKKHFTLDSFGHFKEKYYLCTAFCKKTLLLTNKTYYEPVRNRFHFDSRFV